MKAEGPSSLVFIVGVGDNGPESLDARARAVVESSEMLVGGHRLLEMFNGSAQKIPVTGKLDEAVQAIRENRGKRRITVLASGDPLFHGIARTLMSRLPREWFEVLPNVSSMQLAFARAKEPWDDALFVSVHGKPLETLADHLGARKLGLFTDDRNTPDAIARFLLARGGAGWRMVVCENLAGPHERVVEGAPADIAAQKFAPLNVVVLVRQEGGEGDGGRVEWPGFGVPEGLFLQRKPKAGLITKTEVRVVALSKMRLRPDSVVWDIGAGSGSVAIEAARLAPGGRTFAVEKNAGDADLIRANCARFGAGNVEVVHGSAPDALAGLPPPDAVFVGGTDGKMEAILSAVARALKPGGRVVLSFATLENLSEAWRALKDLGMEAEVSQISVARGAPILEMTRLEALNPVFLVSASRREALTGSEADRVAAWRRDG